jgi:hypothetical protein
MLGPCMGQEGGHAQVCPPRVGRYTWFFAVGSAPARSSSSTTAMCPSWAARCSGVLPACAVQHQLLNTSMRQAARLGCTGHRLSKTARLHGDTSERPEALQCRWAPYLACHAVHVGALLQQLLNRLHTAMFAGGQQLQVGVLMTGRQQQTQHWSPHWAQVHRDTTND